MCRIFLRYIALYQVSFKAYPCSIHTMATTLLILGQKIIVKCLKIIWELFGKVSSKLNKEISTIEKTIKELKDYSLIKNSNN